jgi:Transposase
MAMLADSVEVVLGVDTHKHSHTAAVVAATTGAMIAQVTVPAIPAGYQQLLDLADQHHRQRGWAIERTGGDGAGLTRSLPANAEQVVELDRPKRAARRHGAKSDPLDVTRAAREALGRDQLAQPPATGPGRRCRCGWPPAARPSRPPGWPTPAPRPGHRGPRAWGNGSGSAPPASWWPPAPGYGSTPIGMWRL